MRFTRGMGLFRKATVLTLAVLSVSAVTLMALNVFGASPKHQDSAKAKSATSTKIASAQVSARTSSRLRPPPARAHLDKGPAFTRGCSEMRRDSRVIACHFGKRDSDTTIALFGDSHALQYSPPLIQLANRRGLHLVTFLRGRCVISDVNFERPCDRWRNAAIRRIQALKPDRIVVSASTGSKYQVKRGGRKLSRQASERFLRPGMARILRRLANTRTEEGRRPLVTLIRDQPIARFMPSKCLTRFPNRPARCSFPARRPNPPGFTVMGARRVPAVRIVNPTPLFCRNGRCPAVRGNIVVFRDSYHLSATYARTLAGWLAKRIGV